MINQYPLWRYILLVLLIVAGVIYALPNLYGDDPAVQVSSSESTSIAATVPTTIRHTLNNQTIPFISITQQPHSILVRLKRADDQLKAKDAIQAALGNEYSVALNLAPRVPHWLAAIGAEPMKL